MIAQPIRVLIVDDHPAFRVGLRALLGSRGDSEIEVVGEAESGEDALRTAIECTPDVVVIVLHWRASAESRPPARWSRRSHTCAC